MDTVLVDQTEIARSFSHMAPAHYIVQIKSFSLLSEKEVEKYESGEFEAGGYKWKLVLYPNGNKGRNVKDHLSLYLSMANTSSLSFGWEVYAIFRLFLLDQNQDKYLIVQDAMEKERRFHGLKLEWGFDEFISLQAFKDDSNGYLVEDTCAFGAEVFVKERNTIKGECLSMINSTSSSKYVWKIENFSKLDSQLQESEVFNAGDYQWKIRLYPNGDRSATGTHLSLFLVLADFSSPLKIYAAFTLQILDQLNGRHLSMKHKKWFDAAGSGWGKLQLVERSYLNEPSNGCLVKDVCVVEAEVTVLGISKLL